MTRYLFSFRGRIGRARFWLILPILFGVAVATLLSVPITRAALPPRAGTLVIGFFAIGMAAVFVFVAAAVAAKRLHDRNRSAWWLCTLLPQIPVALLLSPEGALPLLHTAGVNATIGWLYAPVMVWLLIELGILRGTVGVNRYGEPPRMTIADVFS